ncbi:hypothetical protein BD413DRAFT_133032 [Trametes elegans]|nr:hypothetical protein BD413DRAFT_133032 [Trametes elegans]
MMQHPKSESGPILSLNDHALDSILTGLDKASLLVMSTTCQAIRKHCLPILFHEASVVSKTSCIQKRFLPENLWRYVSVLHLVDHCLDMYTGTPLDLQERLWFAPDYLLCGIYDSLTLQNALQHMPQLHSVQLHMWDTIATHGLPWSVLRPILSLPNLREFAIQFLRFAPDACSKEALAFNSPAPLTSFECTLNHRRVAAPYGPVEGNEQLALSVVLHGIHQTLERLVLTTDHAPLDDICFTLSWPCLRELVLRGEFRTVGDPPLPFVRLLANMPKLRNLDLRISQPPDIEPQPVWPADLPNMLLPWPGLQQLTVSCPQPDDKVYAALPYSLRCLSLRYYPHLSTHQWTLRDERVWREWQWPLLGSSDVLRILRACDLPVLEHLELEYVENDADDDLLRFLGSAFAPTMTSLTIRRYRRKPSTHVPLDGICEALGALPRLHTLSLHLDFHDTPKVYYRPLRVGGYEEYRLEDICAFEEKLLGVANMLARALGPALEMVKLAMPWVGGGAAWLEYDIFREAGGAAHAQYVHTDIGKGRKVQRRMR